MRLSQCDTCHKSIDGTMFVVFDSQKRKASFFCSEGCMKNFDSEAIIRQT